MNNTIFTDIAPGATGDIEGVTAGDGLTGGGTTGTVTLNVGAGTGIAVSGSAVSVDVSDFMTNGSNNRILTATGTDAINAEANLTFDGNELVLDDVVTDTNAGTYTAITVDFDKTGASTSNNTLIGIDVDMDNTTATAGTNTLTAIRATPTLIHAADAGTTLIKGLEVVATGGTPGGSTTRALDLTATGADFNQGIFMKVDDGGPDIKMLSSADTADSATIATGANGALTITTTDGAAAAADLTLNIDGDIVLDSAEGKWRFKKATSGRLKIDESNSGDVQIELAQADKKLEFKGTDGASAITALELDMALAGKATFGGNVVIGGTTPKLTIGDTDAEDTMLAFDGNAQDFRIGIDDGTDTLEIGVGTAHGTTKTMSLDAAQNIDIFGMLTIDTAIADEKCSGITAAFEAGEALVRGDVVYFKAGDSKMHKVNMTAGNSEAIPAVAMAAEDISINTVGKFLMQGVIHDAGTFPTYTVAGRLYAPEAEGPPTQTKPSTDGDLVQVIGWAITADKIYFNPSPDYIEVA
jgi:hypothetical protein